MIDVVANSALLRKRRQDFQDFIAEVATREGLTPEDKSLANLINLIHYHRHGIEIGLSFRLWIDYFNGQQETILENGGRQWLPRLRGNFLLTSKTLTHFMEGSSIFIQLC